MQTTSEEKEQKTEMSFADRLFFVVAMCLAVFIKPSQYLMERSYKLSDVGSVVRFFGILSAAVSAIATGYWFGLEAGRTWVATLTLGAASGAFMYFYGVPFFYCFLKDWIVELGRYFWKRVPEPGKEKNSYGLSPWFSNLLMNLGYVAVAGGSVGLFLKVSISLHTSMDAQSSLSSLFAWLVAGVLAFVVTLMAGSFAVKVLHAKMPGLAIISGALLIWGTGSFLFGSFGLPDWLVLGLDGFSFIVWVGAIFPALHVLVSGRFQWLADWVKSVWIKWRDAVKRFYRSVYIDPSREFKGFFGQSINIAAALVAFYLVGSHISTAGFGWMATGLLSFVAMLAVYIIGGAIINFSPNGFVIGAISLIPSFWVGSNFAGFMTAVFAGIVTETIMVGLVMPVVYQIFSAIVEHTIGHAAGLTLLRVHKEMVENISTSWNTTFRDRSDYAEQFAHFANVLVAAGGFIAIRSLLELSGLNGALGLLITIKATIALYLAGGKFLPVWGNRFLAGLGGFFFGLWCGIATYHAGGESLLVGLPALAGGWLFVALLVYPAFYATTKAPFAAMGVSSWLFGSFKSMHAFFFAFVERFWNGVMQAYRAIQFNFRPAWQRVSRLWDENWQRAREAMNKVFGS